MPAALRCAERWRTSRGLSTHWGGSDGVDDVEYPDLMVFDLDPGEGVPWAFMVDTARALRDFLRQDGFSCWPKATGGKGLHVMVPLVARLSHDQCVSGRMRSRSGLRSWTPATPRFRHCTIAKAAYSSIICAMAAAKPRLAPGLRARGQTFQWPFRGSGSKWDAACTRTRSRWRR